MLPCHFFLVRHGETSWNAVGRIQGQTDIPLNKVGHEQAAELARQLAAETFAAVYASDLSRAMETATPIAAQKDLPIQKEPRLRELDFGDFEGRSAIELRQQYPDWFRRFVSTTPDFEVPNGESYPSFFGRVTGALSDIAPKHAGQKVLVVVHGGVISCALRRALPAQEKSRHLLVKNGSITRIDVAGSAGENWCVVNSDALR